MAVIRILGIDPGTQVVGFGCLELQVGDARAPMAGAPLAMRASNVVRAGSGGSDSVRPVECGVLRLGTRRHTVAERLRELSDRFRELVARLCRHLGVTPGEVTADGAVSVGYTSCTGLGRNTDPTCGIAKSKSARSRASSSGVTRDRCA